MPEHIPKEKNLNFNNSSNKSDLSSISKFSKSSDNLEYYQNMANSSLKVSQLQKIQDTANENPIQLQTEDKLNDQEINSESNILQLEDLPTPPGRRTEAKKPTNNSLDAIPEGIGEGDDSDLYDQENNPEWNELSKEQRSALLDDFLNGKISPVLATYIKRKGIDRELPEPEDLLTTATIKTHLNKFRGYSGGASRFDTPKNFEQMKTEWGFGREGGAFIATKTESLEAQIKAQEKVTDQEVAEGSKLPGLWSLASDLAVPPENWIDKSLGGKQDNPNHKMIRTDIPDPEKFDLAMVKGNEMSAYQKEWLAGGKTLGGKNEAKIKKMNKEKLNSEIMWGNVKPNPVEFKETPKMNMEKKVKLKETPEMNKEKTENEEEERG